MALVGGGEWSLWQRAFEESFIAVCVQEVSVITVWLDDEQDFVIHVLQRRLNIEFPTLSSRLYEEATYM